jgi:glutaconate CoA-transferase subunit A
MMGMQIRGRMDKQISLEQAVEMVASGSMIGLGGMTIYRRPVAFVTALVKRFLQTGAPSDLTLMSFTAGPESDLLVGAGMISKVRTCYFGFEIFGLAPMFTYRANRGEIEIIEETEASIALGLRARMGGIGFMPGRAWTGTDLPKLRPDVKTVIDPYTGETLMAFPAVAPDLSVIHAIKADPDGNAQIGENLAVDQELALASGKLIVTAEEIVPELTKADIIAPLVTAVVHTPGGAKPTSCHPLYPVDGEALLAYVENVSDDDSFLKFVNAGLWGSKR